MKKLLYIIIAFIVISCTSQQPKSRHFGENDGFNLHDTIYEYDSTIMIIHTDSSVIWQNNQRK